MAKNLKKVGYIIQTADGNVSVRAPEVYNNIAGACGLTKSNGSQSAKRSGSAIELARAARIVIIRARYIFKKATSTTAAVFKSISLICDIDKAEGAVNAILDAKLSNIPNCDDGTIVGASIRRRRRLG